MTQFDPSRFLASYDLADRGLDSISSVDDRIVMVFDLFHCDDPDRDREDMTYTLRMVFAEESVIAREGRLFQPRPQVTGEVLQYEAGRDYVRFGVEWTDHSAHITAWSVFDVIASPLEVQETSEPTNSCS